MAIWSPRRPIAPGLLDRATAVLDHRGPDGRGSWIADDRRVALGHTRLSIIDLVTGDQPIANEDGRLHLVVNGEFYGYEALQRQLLQAGHTLRTRSDSEIALHLYEERGTQCLHQLRGEFAFVLCDGANQTLFAARDRFGIKPLFYAVVDGALVLASEVKALFAAGVPARWNRTGMYHMLGVGIDEPETLYDGVLQVPPGHYLLASGEDVRLHRYWDFDYPRRRDMGRERPDGEYVAEFRTALQEAVRLRLRADVPVGCYLSGGIDSSAVLGLAASQSSRPIRAFTLAFEDAAYDESAIACEMAQRANTEFHPITIRQGDLADHIFDAAWNAEMFFFNAHGVAKYILSRAVHEAGYKVVLTGEGSDEVLGGYAHFRRDMLLYDNDGQEPAVVQRLLDELERSNTVSRGLLLPDRIVPSLEDVRRQLGFVPSVVEIALGRLAGVEPLFTDEFGAQFAGISHGRSLLNGVDVCGQLADRSPMNVALYLNAKTALPRYILTVLGDRMEMAHSVEARLPFLDHEVVELLTRMPVRLKIRGMTEKFALREAVRAELTDTVYGRQKHPFLSPPALLNPEDRLYALLNDVLRGPLLRAQPFFDPSRVVTLLDRLPALSAPERVVMDQCLMIVLSTCALQDRLRLSS